MRRWIGLLFLLALASAQVVREGWVRFSPGPNAAAYLTLENPGDLPLRLVGARTPVAERVELHETFMREVEGKKVKDTSLRVPPGEGGIVVRTVRLRRGDPGVELKPGGYHFMLLGLKRPLKAGEEVELDLLFAGGKVLKVVLPVEAR